MFEPEMQVICIDDENIEALVTKNQIYTIKDVSHRGALILLHGLNVSLASNRFVRLNSLPTNSLEIAHASNQ